MMVRFEWYFDSLAPHQLKQNKKKQIKNYLRVGPPLTKLSGSAHSASGSYVLKPIALRTNYLYPAWTNYASFI